MSTWSVPHNFIHSTHELDVKADPTMASITSLAKKTLRRQVTPIMLLTVITAALSSTMYGYNMSKLNTPYEILLSFINATYTERNGVEPAPTFLTLIWSVIISAFVGAGALGSFSSGVFAEKFGRRRGLFINHLLAFASAAAEMAAYYCKVYELLIVGRAIIGFNSGISQGLVSLYIAEVSPKQVRGAFLSFHQIGIVIGILLGQVLSLEFVLGGVNTWPFLCGFSVMPCLLSCCLLPLCPESPRYLLSVRKDEAAAKAALLRLTRSKHAAKELLNEIREEEKVVSSRPDLYESFQYRDLFTRPELRRSLMMSALLNVSQQWSGINAIFAYSHSVFYNAGVDPETIQYAIIGTGVINVVVTFISLALIEKVGRRKLLLIPNWILVGSLLVLTACINQQSNFAWLNYLTICIMLAYIVGFGLGFGPLTSMITCETFEQQARPQAMAVIQTVHYVSCFVLMLTFKFMEAAMKEFIFMLFACIVAVATTFLMFYLPESAHRSVKEVVADIKDGWRWRPCNGSDGAESEGAEIARKRRKRGSSGTYIKRADARPEDLQLQAAVTTPLRKADYDADDDLEEV
ncbi:hypothetical protein BOX15_Mlig005404g1 [Macrostomum lignano]|uniref:Major facilitator superfamily (MFS) profile domain-containing protein n=1 Tax=Macrostomum lignano TaxID=282301 RepID=A0A267F3K8_9PLAT|nr:hypothetical protein BOX15_Mlig005404g1 [Macrostomum lignano]